LDQILERCHIPAIVSRLINWRLGNESCFGQPRIVQQSTERLQPYVSLANMLMPIELRSARGFSVITMPDRDILQPNCAIELKQCVLHSFLGHNVVPGYMNMAGIDACRDGNVMP
jgi:hypothetical protein